MQMNIYFTACGYQPPSTWMVDRCQSQRSVRRSHHAGSTRRLRVRSHVSARFRVLRVHRWRNQSARARHHAGSTRHLCVRSRASARYRVLRVHRCRSQSARARRRAGSTRHPRVRNHVSARRRALLVDQFARRLSTAADARLTTVAIENVSRVAARHCTRYRRRQCAAGSCRRAVHASDSPAHARHQDRRSPPRVQTPNALRATWTATASGRRRSAATLVLVGVLSATAPASRARQFPTAPGATSAWKRILDSRGRKVASRLVKAVLCRSRARPPVTEMSNEAARPQRGLPDGLDYLRLEKTKRVSRIPKNHCRLQTQHVAVHQSLEHLWVRWIAVECGGLPGAVQ